MASGYARMTLLGYLARDVKFVPKKSDTDSDLAYITMLYEPYIGKDKKADTIAFDITLVGTDAITANKYTKKGSQVLVEAEPRSITAAYKDGQPVKSTKDGRHIVNTQLTARTFRLADRAADGNANAAAQAGSATTASAGAAAAAPVVPADDGDPF